MSRNDIEMGQITLHPAGIPHGPHPGAYERSIEKKSTEVAVMVDTFKPLKLTQQALDIEVKDYYKSAGYIKTKMMKEVKNIDYGLENISRGTRFLTLLEQTMLNSM